MSEDDKQKIEEINKLIKQLEQAQASFTLEFEKARSEFNAACGKLRQIIDSAKAEKIKQELNK